MGFEYLMPESIKPGFYWKWPNPTGLVSKRRFVFACAIYAHTLQRGERWLFLIRINKRMFGYRMAGDHKDHQEVGWYFPWQDRFCSGRW